MPGTAPVSNMGLDLEMDCSLHGPWPVVAPEPPCTLMGPGSILLWLPQACMLLSAWTQVPSVMAFKMPYAHACTSAWHCTCCFPAWACTHRQSSSTVCCCCVACTTQVWPRNELSQNRDRIHPMHTCLFILLLSNSVVKSHLANHL